MNRQLAPISPMRGMSRGSARTASPGRVRVGAAVAVLSAVAALGVGAAAPAQAAVSLKQAQFNLAGLGYLSYGRIDGLNGPSTRAAVRAFQADQCMDADGTVGERTSARLVAQMQAVQGVVGAARDGRNGPGTRAAIARWQTSRGLTADGAAGGATMARMKIARTRACGGKVLTPINKDASSVPCAAGTRDLGVHPAYASGRQIPARLCAVTGLKSTSEESRRGSTYYVKGADGDAIVNARVSGAFAGLFLAAQNSGIRLTAASSFRTMAHQKALCQSNSLCRKGDYTFVAKPGTSLHQLGAAIDFAGTSRKGGSSCASRATDSGSLTWRFLERNARRFGIKQYAPESWHWDALRASNRC